MPPWGVGERITLYRMKGKKSGQYPVEYSGEVVEIGGPGVTMVGKYQGRRFRDIRITFNVKFAHMTRKNRLWLKWFEGETQARDSETYSWIESNEQEAAPIIFDY